jgi:glycosyltransferase involved in cell wall biosynthesis/GT2 family glycosyltransferase
LPDDLVSIVIPAYNPTSYLLEAIASASAQTHRNVEIVLVNDGTDKPESRTVLAQAAPLVGTYIEQPNRGLGAARNAGFRASHGEYVVPLDADDLIEPAYVAESLTALRDSDADFAYTDFQVFGTQSFRERPGRYNLYRLLDRNYLTYAALIRKAAWGEARGYDESMRLGYEDWEFWLRLGSLGRFGRYVAKSLFRYRKHGDSLYDTARAHHAEIVAHIQGRHPELYRYENRARIKACWSPAVSIIALEPTDNQTIEDIEVIAPGEAASAPAVITAVDSLEPEAAELAALAAWSGKAAPQPLRPSAGSSLHRHLLNAELLSLRSWTHHPARSLARLIPLRMKERINRAAGRPVFDLTFYLQFQPNSVLLGDVVVEPLVYYPRAAQGRKRVALITTHLGPGGAEKVLYDIASTLSPSRFETLLLATQSRDDRWLGKWRERVGHVYDLARVVNSDQMTAAVCSMVSNWRCDYLLLQNSLYGYAALPHLKKLLPAIQIIDLIHYVDEGWDQIASTAEVASYIDRRVALAESVRDRLLATGTPESKILQARNGVDLERFQAAPVDAASAVKQILFAARLEPRKQPLLLADIARELSKLRPHGDFRFVIAGDGPQKERFEHRVHKLGLDGVFDFRGQVDDLAPLFAASDILVHPSRSEGVPLVILEALASARPVVAFKVGSIPEVLDSSCGILVERFDAAAEFARAINSLLGQRELREKMGAAGRRKMETSHDIRKTLVAVQGLFEQNSAVDQGASVSVSSTSRSTAIE